MDGSSYKGKDELPPATEWPWERFEEVDVGDGEIALWSKIHSRFIRLRDNPHGNYMDGSDVVGSKFDLKPKSEWTWERMKIKEIHAPSTEPYEKQLKAGEVIALHSYSHNRFIKMNAHSDMVRSDEKNE